MKDVRPPGYPDTTELDRRKACLGDSRVLSQFLDWCDQTQIRLTVVHEHEGSDDPDDGDEFGTGCFQKHECSKFCHSRASDLKRCKAKETPCSCPVAEKICGRTQGELCEIVWSKEKLLAKYFNIDLKKIDQEQEALLEWLRMSPQERDAAGRADTSKKK